MRSLPKTGLVDAATMTCVGLDQNDRDPLDELLATIGDKLRVTAASVREFGCDGR